MSDHHELLKEKLRRVLALAESGVDGERENARRMLEELLRKHGLRIEDLTDEGVDSYQFKVTDWYERGILDCVVVYVTGTRKILRKETTRCVYYRLTKLQEVGVRDCFDHYVGLWRDNLKTMIGAFVNRYGISLPPQEGAAASSGRTSEELERLIAMARALKGEQWNGRKKLAESTLA
jgi:hypothetical protein